MPECGSSNMHQVCSTESPRVCHISTVHAPVDVRIVTRECRSLVHAGYEVHLIIRAHESGLRDGIHVHAIRSAKNRLLRMLLMPWVALRAALKTKAAIYHYHDPELLPMGFVLRWVYRRKVVFDVHESVPRQIMSKSYLPAFTRKAISTAYRLVERLFIAGQTIVVANEHCMRDYPRRSYLVRNYPLLDDRVLRSVPATKPPSAVPLLVYVGGVAHIRGAEVYMALARELAARQHDFRMHIVGPYSSAYGRYLESLRDEWGLNDRVVLPGRVDWVEAMQLAAQATIGLCLLLPVPNYTVCLATKIIEYMMVGTPVLASNFDVWRPYVEGEGVGRLANPGDVDEVTDVCEAMLAAPEQLEEMGRRGIQAVRDKYNWSSEFAQLLDCYSQLRKGR